MHRSGIGRFARVVVAAMVIGAGCVAVAGPAGAATTWTRVRSPNPGPAGNLFNGISCVTPTSCTAVGIFFPKPTVAALIEQTTDGLHWHRLRAPAHLPDSTGDGLQAVSCTTASDCTAVGESVFPETATRRAVVIRTTDGVTWTRVFDARFGRVAGDLTGISCVSATQCTAVGHTERTTVVVRTDDGVHWVRQRSPNPGRGESSLNAVSCTTSTSCVAVGDFTQDTSGGYTRTLVLRTTDGATWSRVPTPNPTAVNGVNTLAGVSCVGPVCVAVGHVNPSRGGTYRAFVLRTTDGTTWTRSSTPANNGPINLLGVSCVTATTCAASGFARSADFAVSRTYMLQTSDGTSWSEHASRTPGFETDPNGVSCAVVDRCVAAGAWMGERPVGGIPQHTLILKEG